MAFLSKVLLAAVLAALLVPLASASDGWSDPPGDSYPHCENVLQSPRTCLCPWPPPAHNLVCPVPG